MAGQSERQVRFDSGVEVSPADAVFMASNVIFQKCFLVYVLQHCGKIKPDSRIDFLPCIMACEKNVRGYAPRYPSIDLYSELDTLA